MDRPTDDVLSGMLEGYAWELEQAKRRADPTTKADLDRRISEVRTAADALDSGLAAPAD